LKSDVLRVATIAASFLVVLAIALVLLGARPAEAAFPGNNGNIAFVSNRSIASGDPSASDSEIFTAPLVGDLTQLTSNSTKDFSPTWSADGTKIAFVTSRNGNEEIYLMNADATGGAKLTENQVTDYSPAWSPDGNKILFMSGRDFNAEIYAMNADGSSQFNLTGQPAADDEPDWQPIIP
jgi:Tol biopolymer transport system component